MVCMVLYRGIKRHTFSVKKHNVEVRNGDILEKCVARRKKCIFSEPFPLFKGPARADMGPYWTLWAHMDPKNPKKYIKGSPYRPGPGLGPSPGWGPVRVGAHMGPYGP